MSTPDYSDLMSLFNAPAAERSQMIADLFNSSGNPQTYADFRLTQVSRGSRMSQHVYDLSQSQADGTALAAEIASKTDATTDTTPLHAALDALRTRQQQNKPVLEKTATELAELQQVFNILVGAEQRMKGWSNINLLNIQDAAEKLDDKAAQLREISDALPARDEALNALEKSLQKLEKSIRLRKQRDDLAAYLKSGIAMNANVPAPKTARFSRRPKTVQP